MVKKHISNIITILIIFSLVFLSGCINNGELGVVTGGCSRDRYLEDEVLFYGAVNDIFWFNRSNWIIGFVFDNEKHESYANYEVMSLGGNIFLAGTSGFMTSKNVNDLFYETHYRAIGHYLPDDIWFQGEDKIFYLYNTQNTDLIDDLLIKAIFEYIIEHVFLQ